MNDREQQEELIFEKAAQIASDAERAGYLEQACRGDSALRARLELLLEGHFKGQGFLDGKSGQAEGPTGTLRVSPPGEEEVGTVIGHYKLLEKVGEGGFGAVYVAEQREPVKRRVALKIIKLGMDTKQVIARFEAERQALALMDHPNIAKVLDAGATETGRPYFVMELVRGMRITDYCDQNNLPTAERLDLFMQVCHAIQHAHQKGIIHRDIKPSNMLVTVVDGRPVPKVIDFGIAKATQGGLTDKTVYTQLHQFIGTPAYMSPEQAQLSGVDVDTRSDIYSLGVLLYELLTGRTPFDSKTLLAAGLDEMRRMIREQEPPWPSTRISTLDEAERTTVAKHRQAEPTALSRLVRGDLDWIVMKCLEKERGRRYETANGLAQDIEHHLNQEPVMAAAPTLRYRLAKFTRRNRAVLATTAAFVLLLLAGTTVSVWEAVQATWNAAEAGRQATRAAELAAQESQQRQRATASAQESRQRLVRLNLANGTRAADQGNFADALLWFVEAFQLEAGDPGQEPMHRLRLASAIQPLPRLVQIFFHQGPVTAAAWSADGLRLATASQDHTARVWSVATAGPLTSPLVHGTNVVQVLFSPDDHWLITASEDQTLRVWNASTGEPVGVPVRCPGRILGLACSPDSRRLASKHEDGTARLWDLETGRPLTPPLVHAGAVTRVCFNANGTDLATASQDHTARVWNALTGAPASPPLEHGAAVNSVVFSPDGQRVLTASADQTASVWDLSAGKMVFAPLKHDGPVEAAAFTPEGYRIVTAGADKKLRFWSSLTGEPLLLPASSDQGFTSLAVSPDGRRVVTCGAANSAEVWDVATAKRLERTLPHGAQVMFAAFSSCCRYVVTTGADGTARVWDVEWDPHPAELGHLSTCTCATYSRDGSKVLTGTKEGEASVWNSGSGNLLISGVRHSNSVTHVAFSQDGRRFATASADHTARVWDTLTGAPVTPPLHHQDVVRTARFSPSGRQVVTASGSTAQVWDAGTGAALGPALSHAGPVNWADYSPDGRWIATASQDRTAQIWDAAMGQRAGSPLQHPAAVLRLGFSPDSRSLISGDTNGTARLWEIPAGRLLTAALVHGQPVTDVSFSHDGRLVATASRDGSARIWEAATGKPLTQPLVHGAPVLRAAISPDGRLVATAGENNIVRVWDAALGEPVLLPLQHLPPVSSVAFRPDGKQLLTVHRAFYASLWDLTQDVRPGSVISPLAGLMAGRRIDETGGIVPISPQALRGRWEELRAAYPHEFALALPDPDMDQRQARACEDDHQWYAAGYHLDRLLALKPNDPALRERRSRAQQEYQATTRTLAQFRRFPPRDPQTPARLIDLTDYYNGSLSDSWQYAKPGGGNDLGELPTGIQKLAGVDFDIRGVVQLAGFSSLWSLEVRFPTNVSGIKVNTKGRRLHFLHATAWQDRPGAKIGMYVVHFANGHVWGIPICYGLDVLDWWYYSYNPAKPERAEVAWSGRNADVAKIGMSLRLFRSTWENPWPDETIASIDFTSAMNNPSPFLVAITLE